MENYGFTYNRELEKFEKLMLPEPVMGPYDLLVAVSGVSVNPVDLKLAQVSPADTVLGFDAVGIIKELGEEVNGFQVGQRVFYAGTTQRPGSNQKLQLVDSRIVATAPVSLTDGQAVALPLTGLTAWELLFEQMGAAASSRANSGEVLLINGGGGVGSIAAQLATWAGFEVSATASPKNFYWLQQNQVSHCLDYHHDLLAQTGAARYDNVLSFFDIGPYLPSVAKMIKPFGQIGTIVETKTDLPMNLIKNSNISFFWEYMFAKTDFNYQIASQGVILRELAALVDAGEIHSTLSQEITGGINPETLQRAYELVAQGQSGKVVITGGFQ